MNLKRIICKSLGDKASDDDKFADKVCGCRFLFTLLNIITCCFIIANACYNIF